LCLISIRASVLPLSFSLLDGPAPSTAVLGSVPFVMQQEYIGDNLEELIDEEAASVACNLANTVDICGLGVFGEKVLGVADRDDDVVD